MCVIDDKTMFNVGKYVYSYLGKSYQREVVTRIDYEIDNKNIFDLFIFE